MRAWTTRLLLFVLAAGWLAPHARAGDPPPGYKAAVDDYVTELHAFAEWCRKAKLYGRRDEVYEALLVHAPEDPKARQWLRYKQQDDGTWVQNARYKRPRNWSRTKLAEYPDRRSKIDAVYRDAVLAVLRSCDGPSALKWAAETATALGKELDDPQPKQIARELHMRRFALAQEQGDVATMDSVESLLLAQAPEDTELRLLFGHWRHEERWMLTETAQTRRRRPVIVAAANKAIATAGPAEEVTLNAAEAVLGMADLRAFEQKHMRAVGSGEAEDLQQFAAACEAAGPYFEIMLGHAPKRRPQNTAFLFSREGELDEFLLRYPGNDSPLIKTFRELKLHITWLDGRTMMADKNPANAQLDLALNMLFTVMLSDTFFGSKNLKGWLDEGISRHLTYLLVGTRLSVGLGGRYGDKQKDDTRHVPESKDAWLKVAYANLSKSKKLDLRLTLGKAVDAFTVRDSLLSYAFAVYLLEGRPKEATPFLEAMGADKGLDVACTEAFGFPVPVLEARLLRWLKEMTSPAAPSGS